MIDGEKAAKIDARLFEGIRDLAMTLITLSAEAAASYPALSTELSFPV